MGKVVGIRRGSVYDVETVKSNAEFTMTLFGVNLWPSRYDLIWLTNADRCADSFRLNKAVYYMNVVDEFSYGNVLVVELKNGIPEDDHLYLLCVKPSLSDKHTAANIRVKMLASRNAYWMPFSLQAMILIILFMLAMSALFSGLNLSFTSVAISELNIITRMGDAYKSRLAKNVIPVRKHLNWLICTFATANAIINCGLSLLLENFLQYISDGRLPFLPLTLVTCIITVIFGELFPLVASKTRHITWFAMILLSPVAWPISKILDVILGSKGCEVYDRSKIEFLILEAARTSSVVFSEILKNAINLPRIRVGNVMTQIDEAFLLSTTDALDNKLILSIVEKGYSRIPVYEGSKRSKVIAVLNVKDLITTDFNKNVAVIDILKKLNYLKQVRFVCEEMQVKPLLNEMEGQNFAFEPKGYISHLAMVVKYDSKSYSLVGLITLDDIIEEIFGEMKELSFNIHTMRRLFNLCPIHSPFGTAKKFTVYKQGCKSRSVAVMLAGEAFYQDVAGNRVAATPPELGVELIEQIYLSCLDKGTSVDLSNLYFMPLKTVYVKPPFHYIKITVRAILMAMQITEVNEYRREVSEARNTKDATSNVKFSNSPPIGQKSTPNNLSLVGSTPRYTHLGKPQMKNKSEWDDSKQCDTMQDFRRFFWLAIARRPFHRLVIFPKRRNCLTLLQKKQVALTVQRWLFAESIEHIVKKGGNNKKHKYLLTLPLSEYKVEHSPDFIIAGLRDIYQKRLTIQSHVFIESILVPLESKNDNLVEFLQRSGDTHVPFLMSLCGLPMSDATCSAKSAVADRFWNALICANIPITHATMKSRLKILIENEQKFDALQMLKDAETIFNLKPDEEFFTFILQELSVMGSVSTMNWMMREIERRKLSVNKEMKASQIYCYLKNDDNNAMKLLQSAVAEYGTEIEPLIFMVRCQVAIEKRNIQDFKQLLDSYSSSDLPLKLLTDEMVIKFVWFLARNGIDSMGKDHEQLCTEILRKVRKEHGFYKLMVREANRHAVHGMFYSALSYFHSDLHSSAKSIFGSGNDLGRRVEWVGCFSKALINANLPLEEFKTLLTHINRNTHHAHFLLEQILYCVLTHKCLSVQKSLLLTLELLKILDSFCTKIHVVVPLLIRASGVEHRLEILAHFLSAGYDDLNHLSYGVVWKWVLQPLLGEENAKRIKWRTEQLDRIVDIIKAHKIPEDNAYMLLEPALTGISSLERWLKQRRNRNKADVRNNDKIFSSTLEKCVLNQDINKIHEFIKINGSAIIPQLFQPIIMLYICKADWSILMEYIKQMHDDNTGLIHLTIDNVLLILTRHLEEFKDFNMTIDFVYYLQQIVPKDLHSNTRNRKTMRRLIQQSLELSHETIQPLNACSQMFRTLADIKWVQSGFSETVSTSFALAVLKKFGFEEALKVCNFFQFSDFPNGIICLLHYASRISDQNLTNKALAVARTYWPEWKVSVTFGSIMICLEKLEDANHVLQNANIRWINVFQTYKLLCELHFDEAHNFHFNYLNFFSKIMKYNKYDEAYTRLALDCLKNCTQKDPDQAYLLKSFLESIEFSYFVSVLEILRLVNGEVSTCQHEENGALWVWRNVLKS
ncbi:unnamed protein product [Litomosoides sigmodontis]|uniref:CNNM transmembrane domain-containing protein n=1 Tax=Litomosoides sigmodontis TaxID=42156 RepID=A0A3P6TYV1_LITSI|nr:unnamed protein product [Litomosoides sigmodontis]